MQNIDLLSISNIEFETSIFKKIEIELNISLFCPSLKPESGCIRGSAVLSFQGTVRTRYKAKIGSLFEF